MKKILAIVLVMCLLCITAIGTTLSYFTDVDSNDNTMTVGKVGITQKINDSENDITSIKMYPVIVDANGDPVNNVVDMAVTVTMDADSEKAYVRTIFAFEMLKVDGAWVNPFDNEDGVVEVHLVGDVDLTDVVFEKNGVKYVVGVYTYGELEANDVTDPSLEAVYLDSQVGNEFGPAVGGDGYNILILSQAVQTAGFSGADAAFVAAFGAIDEGNVADWFN